MAIKHILVMALAGTCMQGQAQWTAGSGYTHAGTYSRQAPHALLAGANAGLLPQYKSFTATVYAEKRFLLNEFSFIEAGMVLPSASGAFGLLASSFGGAAYIQRKLGLAYGRSLDSRLQAGLQFNYTHQHMADAGILFLGSEKLVAGLQLLHLGGTSWRYLKGAQVPAAVAAGVGFTPSDAFYIGATVTKEADMPLIVQAALQYRVVQKLQVSCGLDTSNSSLYMGVDVERVHLKKAAR